MSTLRGHYECHIRMHDLVSCQKNCLVNKNQSSFYFIIILSLILAEICTH